MKQLGIESYLLTQKVKFGLGSVCDRHFDTKVLQLLQYKSIRVIPVMEVEEAGKAVVLVGACPNDVSIEAQNQVREIQGSVNRGLTAS